jgi:hypothetical protein
MTLDASGNLLVGKTSASYATAGRTCLEIAGSSSSLIELKSGTTSQYLYNDASNLNVWVTNSGAMLFGTSNTERLRITSAGNIHTPAGATTMTNGFFYIPAAAGVPTGVPTAITGTVPMYYDTTNNKFYVYNGAWKSVTLT